MLAEILLITNSNQIEAAKEMGLPVPADIVIKRLFSFDINEIAFAYMNEDGETVLISRNDCPFTIAYNKIIWEAIVKRHEDA